MSDLMRAAVTLGGMVMVLIIGTIGLLTIDMSWWVFFAGIIACLVVATVLSYVSLDYVRRYFDERYAQRGCQCRKVSP